MTQKYYHKTLISGHKLLLIPVKGIKLVRIEARIGVGFFNQGEKYELPHFLEHLQSRFTSTKFPDAMKNSLDLDQRGITHYGETGNYMTRYFLEGLSTEIDYMLDILLYSLTDFKIDDSFVEKERQSAKMEILLRAQERDEMWAKIKDFILRKTDQAKFNLSNRLSSLSKLTVQEMHDFRNTYYSGRNTILVICGDFDPKKAYKTVKKHFQSYPFLDYDYPKIPNASVPIHNPYILHFTSTVDTSTIRIRFFNDIEDYSRDIPMVEALHYLLDGYLSARLYSRLRNVNSQVYNIYSIHESLGNGINSEYFETFTDSENMLEVIKVILEEINLICTEPISLDELTKVKNVLLSNIYSDKLSYSLQSLSNRLAVFASVNADLVDEKTYIKKYEMMDRGTLMKIANKIFNMKKVLICYSSKVNHNDQIAKLIGKKGIKKKSYK